MGATFKQKTLVPVRPAEPLAGAPDKGPIPLADSMAAGAAAIGGGATRARDAAGSRFQRLAWKVQDALPRRSRGSRKVSTASSRFETQRRAAFALLSFVAVAAVLGGGIYLMGGTQPKPGQVIPSVTAAQQAFDAAKASLDSSTAPGRT